MKNCRRKVLPNLHVETATAVAARITPQTSGEIFAESGIGAARITPNHRKSRRVENVAMLQIGILGGYGHFAGPAAIASVVASPARRQRATAISTGVARCAVNDHCLKHQAVAGFRRESDDAMFVTLGFEV